MLPELFVGLSTGYRGAVLFALRLWIYRALPFLGRWSEIAPACCGTCPSCMGATATGATVTWLGSLRRHGDA